MVDIRDESDASAIEAVVAALRVAATEGWRLAGEGASAACRAADAAVADLVGRRVRRAHAGHAPEATPRSGNALPTWVANRGVAAARRAAPVARVASRTPVGLALRFGPVLAETVREQVARIDEVAATVLTRARAAGVEPHPERLRTVVVQILTGDVPDPDRRPDHVRLARTWVTDAGRRSIPLGVGTLVGNRRADVDRALAGFDLDRLA